MYRRILLSVTVLCLINSAANALTFLLQDGNDIVGAIQTIVVKKDESLYQIARKFDVGSYELIEANPKINHKKLIAGQKIVIPSKFILPPQREGVVLNLAELRVYFFHPDNEKVSTFPVGIGRLGWKTPIGETRIVRKREHPTWTPTNAIKNASLRKGIKLPDVMPAGSNNPLGDYAINLSWPSYLIHGTNKPESVGLRSSSGCIRMYPEDIKQLYHLVDINTLVTVIHMPYKVGVENGNVYLEAHDPLPEAYYGYSDLNENEIVEKIIDVASERHFGSVDSSFVSSELKQTFGYPVRLY